LTLDIIRIEFLFKFARVFRIVGHYLDIKKIGYLDLDTFYLSNIWIIWIILDIEGKYMVRWFLLIIIIIRRRGVLSLIPSQKHGLRIEG